MQPRYVYLVRKGINNVGHCGLASTHFYSKQTLLNYLVNKGIKSHVQRPMHKGLKLF